MGCPKCNGFLKRAPKKRDIIIYKNREYKRLICKNCFFEFISVDGKYLEVDFSPKKR